MTQFKFKSELFKEEVDEEVIAEHTVFFIEGHRDLGIWYFSTIENMMKNVAGICYRDTWNVGQDTIRTYFIGEMVPKATFSRHSVGNSETITIDFPKQRISVDFLVFKLNTCKM